MIQLNKLLTTLVVIILLTECNSYLLRKTLSLSPKVKSSNNHSNKQNHIHALNMLDISAIQLSKSLLAVPAMYTLMSINEYITHRYYQHLEFNKQSNLKKIISIFTFSKDSDKVRLKSSGHVEHHAETLDDMSLRIDKKWQAATPSRMLDSDAYRGTSFSWAAVFLMTLQMLPSTIPVFHLLGFSLKATMAFLLPSMLLHTLIWNALHPDMHNLPEVPLSHGPPSKWLAWLRNTSYFKYLYQNHEGHHVLGGIANYNVCCPLVDHLVGTYVEESVWRSKVKSTIGYETNAKKLVMN